MRRTIYGFSLAIVAGALMFAAPSLRAQQKDPTCDDAAQAKYEEFRENIKKNQQVAYEAGKVFLEKCPNYDPTYVTYVKKFIAAYEKASAKNNLAKAINEKQYDQAFTLGHDIIAAEPDDLQDLVNLSYAGYAANASGDKKNNAATIDYAKRAIQLLNSGKALPEGTPFKDKDEALAYLNYTIGDLTVESDPKTAEQYYLNSLKYNSNVKNLPIVYSRLAYIYFTTQYTPLAKDYDTACSGKEPTPQCKVMLDNVYGVTDRIIDAYARAVALSANKPEYAQASADWKQKLEFFYKFRNNNDTKGMDQLVASVLQKPLPEPFTPAPIPEATAPTTGTASSTPPPTSTPATPPTKKP